MPEVCLVGDEDTNLQYELLSRETSRNALASYTLREPFHNSVAVETVSLGAAIALLNDLEWYLVRFVDIAVVKDPSVSEREWLSRELATAIRRDRLDPDESGRFLKVFGLEYGDDVADQSDKGDGEGNGNDSSIPPRLVEPMLVTRTGGTIPEYDLREVAETVVVRVTQDEFGA